MLGVWLAQQGGGSWHSKEGELAQSGGRSWHGREGVLGLKTGGLILQDMESNFTGSSARELLGRLLVLSN